MLVNDTRVLWRLLRGQARSGNHAQRLQAFYAPQASRYDHFRERLLHGREELIDRLAPAADSRVVELGAGTGRNLLFFGSRLDGFERVELVDLCPALLDQARKRTSGMPNVHVIEGDAARWHPREPVDVVYLSYALTMMPEWQRAIDNAMAMLRPGGTLGVLDFYVSDQRPEKGVVQHAALTRWFWPRWFGHDGVHLDPAHLRYLVEHMPAHQLFEYRAKVPYLPGLKAPYYLFVGRKAG